jgi:hypothetical protein
MLIAAAGVSAMAADCDKIREIPVCAEGVKPKMDETTSCPDCRPPIFVRPAAGCSKECAPPAECGAEVKPTIDKDTCCLSCKPARPENCLTRDACALSLKAEGFPVCTVDNKDAFFDKTTCCPTCIPRKPMRPVEPEAKCTKAQFLACVKASKVCEPNDNEKPFADEKACCKTCIRPAAVVPIARVAACGKIDECTEGDAPVFIKEDGVMQCPSCKPAKPVCADACGEKVCVRTKEDATESKCVAKKTKKFVFKGKRDAAINFLKNAEPEEIEAAIKEMVERFCDKMDNEAKCAKLKTKILTGIKVIKVVKADKKPDGGIEVEVVVPTEDDGSVDLTKSEAPEMEMLLGAMSAEEEEMAVTPDAGSDDTSGAATSEATMMVAAITMAALLF